LFPSRFPYFRIYNMKTFIASGIAAAALVSAASADVTFSFNNQTWTGFNFTEAYAAGSLTGNLTGVSVNATLNASTNYTYADDLCVYMDQSPLSLGGLLQVGGFSNLNATQRYSWANGGDSAPGTPVFGTVSLTTAIDMDRNPLQSIWIGNGYGASGTSGTWTGTITLIGVTAVPAPGAFALLGLAGLTGRRRRA
jgi:MYXO-CTERM domain-containing protein